MNKTQRGGLNFPDILQTMYAFRLTFLSRFLDKEYTAIWKYTCQYLFSKVGNMNVCTEILFCNIPPKYLAGLPDFHKSMLKVNDKSKCRNRDRS
jgi:hypothetical protein